MAGREYSVTLRIDGQLNSSMRAALRNAQNALSGLSQSAQSSSAQTSRALQRAQENYDRLSRQLGRVQAVNSLRQTISSASSSLLQMRLQSGRLRQEWSNQESQLTAMEHSLRNLRSVYAENRHSMTAPQRNVMAEQIRQATRELSNQRQAVATARNNFNSQTREADRLNNSLQSQQALLQRVSSAMQDAANSAHHLSTNEATLRAQTETANQRLNRQQNVDSARGRMNDASQNVSYAYGNFQGAVDTARSIMSPFTDAVKTYANFDAVMSEVKAVTGVAGERFDALTAKAREMGASTQFSATEAAGAMVKLGKTGWNDQQILGGIKPLLQTAIAGGADLATTADIVSDTMSTFGKVAGTNMTTSIGTQMEATQRFADVFAATASGANTDINMMGETFKYAAATAGSLGYSIEDVALATGVMGNNAVKGSMAGTALNSIMTRMVAPPATAAKSLDALGISAKNSDGTLKPFRQTIQELRGKFKGLTEAEKAQHAQNIAGTEAMKGFLALMNESDSSFDTLAEKIDNSAGATDKMAATMADNFQGSMKTLESASESVSISLGKVFEPAARGAAQFASRAAVALDEFIQNNQGAVQAVGMLAAGISAVVAGLAGFSLANAGITYLSASFDLLKSRAILARASVAEFWAVQSAGSSSSAAVNAVRNLGSAFASAGRAAMGFVFSPIGAVLTAVALAGLYCYQNWDKVAPIFSNLASVIGGTLTGAVQTLQPALGGLSTSLQSLTPALSVLGGVAFGAFAMILNSVVRVGAVIVQTFATAVSTIVNIFSGLGNAVSSLLAGNFSGVWDGFVQAASAAIEGVKNLLSGIFDGVIDVATHFFDPLTAMLGDAPQTSGGGSFSAPSASIDTSNAQSQVNQLGDASSTAANATNNFATSVETNSTAAQSLNQNITAIGDGATQLSTSLTAVGTEFTNIQTGTQGVALELTNLQTNSQGTSLELTNLQNNAMTTSPAITQLGTDSQNATAGISALGQAASQTAGSLSQIDGAAAAVASALQSKAAEISSIHISVPQVSTVPVAANAQGGIYKQGAFLTTFAEESPEAAIPLDGSNRAKELWTQAGQILGMLPGSPTQNFENGAESFQFSDKIKLPENQNKISSPKINLPQNNSGEKNSVEKIFESVENIFENFSLGNALKFLESSPPAHHAPQENISAPSMPINISISINGNADEKTMQSAGNEIAFELKKHLDDWWREKNHDAERRSFA